MESSKYIDEQRRAYSLYILQSRSIPQLADGLKAAARRALWTARSGEKYKTATLAGRTMPIHPHGECSGSINTLAAPYGNNIPLFAGSGAFGTMLNPTAYGAARYTSVKVSQFTKDVVFKDLDLVPMVENYDGTEMEPQFFLPLVPLIMLNPTSGIAVGFATNILPRSLDDIINLQIKVLKNQKSLPTLTPKFEPTKSEAISNDGSMYYFKGEFERVNSTTLRITKFSYGTSHEKYVEFLENLIEQNKIVDYEDNSKDLIDIEIKFKRGQLSKFDDDSLYNLLKLITRESENLTYIDVDCETVQNDTAEEVVRKFTQWRLTWYVQRYEKLLDEVEQEIQRYKDILLAIKKNVGGMAKKVQSRSELVDFLIEIGVINTDYIASFPLYRFTIEEKNKTEEKLVEAMARAKKYRELLKSDEKRRNIYIDELKNIQQQYRKGSYQAY